MYICAYIYIYILDGHTPRMFRTCRAQDGYDNNHVSSNHKNNNNTDSSHNNNNNNNNININVILI